MTGRLAHRGKRWLFLVHQWIGIGTCLLFLVWFLSGLVMVYVPFPALTPAERLAGLRPVTWEAVRVGPAEAERVASPHFALRSLALEMSADEPVWRVQPWYGPQLTVSARSGELLDSFDADYAARAAAAFGDADVVEVETLVRDQWSVPNGFDPHRPLHRVRLAGPQRRDLYVSGRTGAVVLDTNARERFWNWLGSVPHWIYPTVLRKDNAAWRQVVMWVSGPCILVAITGIWIGILRTRFGRRRYRGGRMTPYHGWMLWHHVAGLAGGLTLTLWIFSGWLSVDPFRILGSAPGLSRDAMAEYAGTDALPETSAARLAAAVGEGARRVEFGWSAGRAWMVAQDGSGGEVVLDAATLEPLRLDEQTLVAAASRLMPDVPVLGVETLTAPDAYWYALASLPRLPVLRIRFADDAGTWVHLDPATGRVLGSLGRRDRVYRWVYDLFHKWDLNVLMLNRPLWDALLWGLSLVGIVTSVTGVYIGWRRLRA